MCDQDYYAMGVYRGMLHGTFNVLTEYVYCVVLPNAF